MKDFINEVKREAIGWVDICYAYDQQKISADQIKRSQYEKKNLIG